MVQQFSFMSWRLFTQKKCTRDDGSYNLKYFIIKKWLQPGVFVALWALALVAYATGEAHFSLPEEL